MLEEGSCIVENGELVLLVHVNAEETIYRFTQNGIKILLNGN